MTWKKKEDGTFGIGKGDIWLWIKKLQFKDKTKALCVNITKAKKGTGIKKDWERVGTLYIQKVDLEQLIYELENFRNNW